VKKQLYEKPEKKDVVADINSEGKYDDNNLVEDDRDHFIKGDGFEDTERMKDEDTEGTRDVGSNDEDEKREAMLINPDSKHREADVVEEKNDASEEEDQEA
jgi:hypothetical protein